MHSLKWKPKAWYEEFCSTIFSLSFTQIQYNSSIFTDDKTSSDIVIHFLYVDINIITNYDYVFWSLRFPICPKASFFVNTSIALFIYYFYSWSQIG